VPAISAALHLLYTVFPVNQVLYQLGLALLYVWALDGIWVVAYAVVSSLVT